jgi:peptidyl-prolyl cis-trans isomerase B (cyclophilin B)
VPTEKQRRQAAQRKLARQLERRREAEHKRRQRYAIGGSAFVVAAIVIVVLFVATDVFSGAHKKAAASPSPSSSASATPSASPSPTASPFATPTFKPAGGKAETTSGACKYAETSTSLKSPYNKNVGLPTDPATTPKTGTVDVSLATSHGAMTFELNRADAPCAVQSFIYLVKKNFFNATSCPRLVTTGIYALQCGDPSNSQQGGPTYSYKQEATSKSSYGTGVIAMANTGAKNSTGSQFFILYKDSNAGLKKSYSVIGKVTRGLSIVDNVAKAGSDNSNQQGDGKPLEGLTIKTATIAA